jgi:hypothetical protein
VSDDLELLKNVSGSEQCPVADSREHQNELSISSVINYPSFIVFQFQKQWAARDEFKMICAMYGDYDGNIPCPYSGCARLVHRT